MKATPAIVPVSELRNDYNHVLKLAQDEPVFLTKNGRAAGVLISTDAWDKLAEKLEALQDTIDVLEAEVAFVKGEEEAVVVDEEELQALKTNYEVPAQTV